MENTQPQINSNTDARSKRPRIDAEYTEATNIGSISVDKDYLDNIVTFAIKNRERALTSAERLDILLLKGFLRHDHMEKQKKNGPGRPIKAPQIRKRISKMLRRKEQLVKEIWAEYVRSSTITKKIVPGNRNAKDGVSLDCRYVTLAVQEFVRERRITRTRTVAKDVMDFLASRSLLYVDRSSEKSVKAGLRAVQRFLVAKGYERGKKKGTKSYRLKEHIAVMRDKYFLQMTEENDKKTRRIVYMDESYIHKNYGRHEYSLYDPNDEQ